MKQGEIKKAIEIAKKIVLHYEALFFLREFC
jgi:hypothetical protein